MDACMRNVLATLWGPRTVYTVLSWGLASLVGTKRWSPRGVLSQLWESNLKGNHQRAAIMDLKAHHHHHHHHHHQQQQQQQFSLRRFKQLMYLSPIIITISSLLLLLYTYRVDNYGLSSQTPIILKPKTSACGPLRQDPHGEKAPIVPVNGTHTLLLSAYLEHRTGKREVRVIAVVLRSEAVAYRCFFCCEGPDISTQPHISEGHASIHSDHFGYPYVTADIMCPVPSGCNTPYHIAVTSAQSEDENRPVFFEVLNQEVLTDFFPHHFTVCMSTMFDFTNVMQLAQTMEMLQLLGVSRVVLYKTSCSPETQRLLDYYIKKGFMEVIPWSMSDYLNVSRGWMPESDPGDLHYFGQIPALNDCIYRYMYQSRYVAMQDIDELILPQSVDSWGKLLPLLKQKYGNENCYMFENFVFPNTVKRPPPTPLPDRLRQKSCCPVWKGVRGVNILEHLHFEPHNDIMYTNFKIIVNPRIVFETSVHGLLHPQGSCVWVQNSLARMYHTRPPKQTELTPDKLIYDGRLLEYSARLIPTVNTVLKEARLIQKDST